MAVKESSIKKKKRWTRDDTELTMLALPTTIWYFLFAFLPMFGIIIAFKKYQISGGFLNSIITSDWIGLDNFKFLFSAGDIWIILRNTILYNIAFINIEHCGSGCDGAAHRAAA